MRSDLFARYREKSQTKGQYQDVHRLVARLGRRVRGSWTPSQLFHLVNGYVFALRAAEVPSRLHLRKIRELIGMTRELTPANFRREYLSRIPEVPESEQRLRGAKTRMREREAHVRRLPKELKALEKRAKLPVDATYSPDSDTILIRAAHPFYLGYAAAHEGLHHLLPEELGHDDFELNPAEVGYSYAAAHPELYARIPKRLRQEHERNTRLAFRNLANILEPEHLRVIFPARIAAHVGASLRSRLGPQKTEEFLQLVRRGTSLLDAYTSVRGEAVPKPLPDGRE